MSSTLFTASCKWQGPEDNEEIMYLGGTTQETYDNLILIDSLDPDYPSSTAFYFQSTESDILGRNIYPNSNDIITINNVGYTINFGVDNDKNLIIVDPSTPLVNVSSMTAKLVRNYASIFSANAVSFNKIIDFSVLNERAITSMISISDGIYLSGTSGNIWFYNGDYIKGPIFTTQDAIELPATCMCVHKFDYETEEYLYVASDNTPRLFRAPLNSAYTGLDWENIYKQGELAAYTGGILSMVSAFNKLFLGCRKNKILIYSRTLSNYLDQPTDFVTETPIIVSQETESLTTSYLLNQHISDLEPVEFGVKCLEVGKNQVFAGIDKKSEIYSYSEVQSKNPESYEYWGNILLDEIFMRDPAPAQFYTANNLTDSRSSNKLAILKFNEYTAAKTKDVLFIKGDNTITSTLFEIGSGSDWEQIQTDILPTQSFINVRAVSTEAITTFTGFTSLDGITFAEGDLFILKNQPVGGSNGIYNGVYTFLSPSPTVYVPLFETNSTKLGFYVTDGYVNGNNRFLLNISDYSTNTLTFYKPKYTFEFEALNLSSGKTTESTIIDGNVYLGIDGQIINNSSGYSYTGFQGLEIQDVYGKYSLEFNPTTLVLSSGNNQISKPLITTGIIKNWSFRNDTVPASPTATTDGWTNYQYSTVTATTESDFNLYGLTYNKYVLNLATTLSDDPAIYNDGLSLEVNQSSFVKIRVKIPPVTQSFSDAYIDFSWAYDTGKFINMTSVELASSDGYVDYIIKPSWKGKISKVMIKFRNLPILSYRPGNIKIDYIQILSDEDIFDLNSTLSTVRIGVEGRDIKVWLGNQISPFIDIKNFISFNAYSAKYNSTTAITTDYEVPIIKIGKLNNYAGESLVGFSRLSFVTGAVYSPISNKIEDFTLSTKLPSTGGVRLFTYHNGTLYSVTDGIVSYKLSDSPEDRQIKLFTYNSNEDFWIEEEANFERKTINNSDGTYQLYGVVRPLTSISYKGVLYVSGQYGNIKNV
jgi:hypothetical protein